MYDTTGEAKMSKTLKEARNLVVEIKRVLKM